MKLIASLLLWFVFPSISRAEGETGETYARCRERAIACDARACAPPIDPLNCSTVEHFQCVQIMNGCSKLRDAPPSDWEELNAGGSSSAGMSSEALP